MPMLFMTHFSNRAFGRPCIPSASLIVRSLSEVYRDAIGIRYINQSSTRQVSSSVTEKTSAIAIQRVVAAANDDRAVGV
jgi:hypothetical protein